MQSLCCKFSTTCVVATNTPYAILVRIYTKGNRDDYEKTVMGNGMKRHCQYVRLNAEKKAIQKDYDAKLSEATKKARKFVKKARVLVDDRPAAVLNLPDAELYK